MKAIYYLRSYNVAGRVVREHFRTTRKRRAEAWQRMFPGSVVVAVQGG